MKPTAHRRPKHHGVSLMVVALCAGALISGCETSSTITQAPNPVKCRVTLATPSPIDAVGGTGSLAVMTQPECVWDAATTAGWISALSPASGQGAGTVVFRAAVNDEASSRDGVIVVNGEQARVSQRAPCRYELSPSTFGTGASGATASLSIVASGECAWTAAPTVTWLTVTSAAAGSGNGSVAFAVAPNRDEVRSGSIVVANQRFVVTQASGVPPAPPPPPPTPPPPSPPPPPACIYSLSRTADYVGAGEGAGGVSVSTTSTCKWTAVSNAPWIIVASGVRTGNGFVEYHHTANPGGLRAGTITIAGLSYTVTQPARP